MDRSLGINSKLYIGNLLNLGQTLQVMFPKPARSCCEWIIEISWEISTSLEGSVPLCPPCCSLVLIRLPPLHRAADGKTFNQGDLLWTTCTPLQYCTADKVLLIRTRATCHTSSSKWGAQWATTGGHVGTVSFILFYSKVQGPTSCTSVLHIQVLTWYKDAADWQPKNVCIFFKSGSFRWNPKIRGNFLLKYLKTVLFCFKIWKLKIRSATMVLYFIFS